MIYLYINQNDLLAKQLKFDDMADTNSNKPAGASGKSTTKYSFSKYFFDDKYYIYSIKAINVCCFLWAVLIFRKCAD